MSASSSHQVQFHIFCKYSYPHPPTPVISPASLLATSCHRTDFLPCYLPRYFVTLAFRLAVTNWWIDNDLCKLCPISRHSRLVVASLNVPATVPVSVCGMDRGCYLVISRPLAQCTAASTTAHGTSASTPSLSLTWYRAASSASGTLMACDWLTIQKGEWRTPVTAFIHSFKCLAAVMKKEGRWGGLRVDCSHTDAAAAVDVLLRYCEQCEQATRMMSSRCVPLNVLL